MLEASHEVSNLLLSLAVDEFAPALFLGCIEEKTGHLGFAQVSDMGLVGHGSRLRTSFRVARTLAESS